MTRWLIIFFGIGSTVALFVVLGLLYRYANESASLAPEEEKVDSIQQIKGLQEEEKETWLAQLATKKPPSFSYPIEEMEIELPLVKSNESQWRYRLLLKNLDAYKLFCLKESLKKLGIAYALFRQKSDGVVVIKNLSRRRLHILEKMVGAYGIVIRKEKYKG